MFAVTVLLRPLCNINFLTGSVWTGESAEYVGFIILCGFRDLLGGYQVATPAAKVGGNTVCQFSMNPLALYMTLHTGTK